MKKIVTMVIMIIVVVGSLQGCGFTDSEDSSKGCSVCGGSGLCNVCGGAGGYLDNGGVARTCISCNGSGVCLLCSGAGEISNVGQEINPVQGTIDNSDYGWVTEESIPDDSYSYESICYMCSGTGYVECAVCDGTGENSTYQYLDGVAKAMSKPYCEACDANGFITCGRCHGSGAN